MLIMLDSTGELLVVTSRCEVSSSGTVTAPIWLLLAVCCKCQQLQQCF